MKTNALSKILTQYNHLKTTIGILLTVLFLTHVSVFADDYAGLGSPSDAVPLSSRVLTGTLSNGLRYYILENSLPENRAHLALVVNAGSVLENNDERGLAHFVEHLAFNDTARFPKLELIEYLRSLGMRFGADANAYTSYDETVYHFDVPVEISGGVKKIPDRALAILDDWTYAVSFLPEDVASESIVVLEELRARLGAMDRARRIMLPVLFEGSAYANREPIGLANIIENATSDQVRAFYDRWYTSDNMALVFVGDFDGKALENSLEDHFNIPAATRPVNRTRHELPPPKNGNFHVEIITDPELTSSIFMIYFKQGQGAQRGSIAYYRESVIDYLISVMLNRRFDEAAVNPDAAATDFWGNIWQWSDNSRFYSMGTTPKTGSVQEALRELLIEKESMRRFAFTEGELERAKLSLVSFMEMQLSEKDRRESRSFIRGLSSHFLHGEDMADIEWEVNAVNSMLADIDLNEISLAAQDYFAANDIVVFLLAPQAEAENLLSGDRIKEIFIETANANIEPRQDIFVSGELLDSVPVSGNIVSQDIDVETGALLLTLSNGARVILKETANRNNEIVFYAMAKGGTANAPQEASISAKVASEMITASGLGPYSRTELINKLAGKQVSFSFWASSFYRGFQGSSTTADLKTFFEILYLSFTMPKIDERAVAAMLDQYRTSLIYQDDDPQNVFSRELTKIVYNNHPLFMPMELGDIDRISIQQALDFVNQCINPADYTFIFTGNFNLEVMREYLSAYVASIPNASSMNQWIDPQIVRPHETEKVIYKGMDDRSMVYLMWFAPGSSGFDERKNQAAAILSEYLDILLTDEIREKLSGVYSISAGAYVSVIPNGEYTLDVFFQCSPSRADELIAAVQERITDIVNQPLNQDTFNKSKEALLMQHEASIQRNLHIAQSYANSFVLYDTPLSRLNSRPDVIRSVTPEEVRELCRDILVLGPVKLVLYPEERQ
ncbi:MAG: insulinase family protein [Treponema sp.]|jgi:zinc protease|nr:insulinase family protein [Treponema sp.]